MSNFIIFDRTASHTDARVRWHKVREVRATSRPDALRKFIQRDAMVGHLAPGHVIDRTTTCVMVTDAVAPALSAYHHMILAFREDAIDFDHYDYNGSLVKVLA